jgi:hypothetical protein
MTLDKLLPEDIEEKIRLNEEAGINVYALRKLINEELKSFQWSIIRQTIQVQCYNEQLEYIDKKILFMEQEIDRKAKEALVEVQREKQESEIT